jgi:hypothetical protein
MNMKSTFLNESIKEEVYVEQPPDFEDDRFHDHMYKLSRRSMGLSKHQKHGMNA